MHPKNLREIYSIVNQVMRGADLVLMDEDFFNDADCDSICFTMKDYHRKGGLATLIGAIEFPGEKKVREQR